MVRAQDLNPEILGSSPALITWICFTVAPFSNPRPRFLTERATLIFQHSKDTRCLKFDWFNQIYIVSNLILQL